LKTIASFVTIMVISVSFSWALKLDFILVVSLDATV